MMGRLIGIARRKMKRAPMETLEWGEISVESGLAGDFRGKPGDRQVTLLSARDWQRACSEVGEQPPWTYRRSNLLIEEMDLPQEAGRIIAIGEARLETTIEINPCSRMDEQLAGLKAALKPDWRGGLGCRVIQGGAVSLGDEVILLN